MNLKYFSLFLICSLMAISCGNKGPYGQKFDPAAAIDIDKAIATFRAGGNKDAVVKGEISKVCQTEGCWFNYKTTGEDQFVDFDHKFEIPKDLAGKTAISKGHFYYDTTTVEMLKEYAKDEGKPASQIDSINAPEIRLVFRATGVMLEEKK